MFEVAMVGVETCCSKEVTMQELNLTGMVDEQGNITLDRPLINCKHKRVRAILFVSDNNLDSREESDWKHLSAEQFFKGYSDTDAIYDED
jgi:hypothetical protein